MEGSIAVGVDVGGTKILLAALDDRGQVLDEIKVESPGDLAGLRAAVTPALAALVSAFGDEPIALGLALPGLVDRHGVLRSAPNLDAPDVGFNLVSELAEPLRIALGRRGASTPVSLENDATAAAFGEVRCGAGQGYEDVLVVSIGTGIGAGLITNGRLVKGGRGYAGEIGHMTIDPDGPLCGCGRLGCWEQLGSGSALARIAEAPRGGLRIVGLPIDRPVRGEDVIDAARRGDAVAIAVIEEFAVNVAIGLVNATELLDPEIIVLGGGLVTASDVVLEPIRQAFVRLSRPAQDRRATDLVPATLGPRAAAIGVGLLALEASASNA